jgi:uncharacterized protein (TIGR03000 family)
MYTMVLVAAMTTSTGTADCWGRGGCYGCSGCSGYYSSCHGCYGCSGCSGCYGCSGWSGCHGCYGWSGACWGGGYNCHGGCYGGPVAWGSCYGGCTGCAGVYSTGVVPMTSVPETSRPTPDKEEVSIRAKVVVEVPADAKLYIDDQLMKTTSERREFRTPPLKKGETYYYEVRAEVMRDGKPVSEMKKIIVRAGEEATANFKEMGSSVAAVKAR